MDALRALELPTRVAAFSFIKDEPKFKYEKPYHFNGPLTEGDAEQRTNYSYDLRNGTIMHDLRGHEQLLNLEQDGLEVLSSSSASFLRTKFDPLQLEEYLLEVIAYLKERCCAQLAIAYSAKIRKNENNWMSLDSEDLSGAANSPHIDHTHEGAPRRIQRHLTASEAEEYLQGGHRLRIINVWRPIHHAVTNAHLAFCDRSTINMHSVLAVDRVIPEYAGEVYYLKDDDDQRWYWLSEQKPSEAFVFVSYDSSFSSEPSGLAHAAFDLECAPHQLPRESVEVRAIVISSEPAI